MERKLATGLFVDLVDSSGLVKASDPEVVRRRVSQFFDQVSTCTSRATAPSRSSPAMRSWRRSERRRRTRTTERAVKAALGILEAVDLPLRIGVESGEVVTESTDSTFATGEP